jgi:hypothetical protein
MIEKIFELTVSRFPAIVDVPRAIQAELQEEADENIEAIRDLKFITEQTDKCMSII